MRNPAAILRTHPRDWTLLLLACLTLLLFPSAAHANAGKPTLKPPVSVTAGQEAHGIPTVTVRQEHLTFDLRAMPSGEAILVTARYDLHNEADALTVPLVFAAFDLQDGQIRFDDHLLEVRELSADELPTTWSTPDGPVPSNTAHRSGASGLGTSLAIPPGDHTLEITYAVTGDFDGWDPGGWVVRYTLTPARSWKAMEALELTVHCPPRWHCLVKDGLDANDDRGPLVQMQQLDDDTLHERWSGFRWDGLTIVAVAPTPWWATAAPWTVAIVTLLLLAALALYAVRTMNESKRRVLTWLGMAFLIQTTSCVGGGAVGMVDVWTEQYVQSYDQMFTLFGFGALGLLFAVVVVPIGVGITGERWR